MKKRLLLLVLICLVTFMSGCSGQKKLERALEAIEEESYTVNQFMKVKVTSSYQGQNIEETIEMDMNLETDPSQMYGEVVMEGQKVYIYAKKVGDEVKTYGKEENEWELLDNEDAMESFVDTEEVLDIDTKDIFKKEDGVWVGNPDKINEQLKDYMDDITEQFMGTGIVLDSAKVYKYDITLDGRDLSKVEIVMVMSMTMYGAKIDMTLTMDMKFSNIGKTTVTVPENLPE